jgi:hypothetical protein
MGDVPKVIPILVDEDIEAGHDDLVSTFGFESGGLHRLDDGTVVRGVREYGARDPEGHRSWFSQPRS